MRGPDRIHVLVGEGIPHKGECIIRVTRVLLRAELEHMQAGKVFVDTKVIAKGCSPGARNLELVRKVEGRPMKLFLKVDLSHRGGLHNVSAVTITHQPDWHRIHLLNNLNLDR
jgi:hypothetical protein